MSPFFRLLVTTVSIRGSIKFAFTRIRQERKYSMKLTSRMLFCKIVTWFHNYLSYKCIIEIIRDLFVFFSLSLSRTNITSLWPDDRSYIRHLIEPWNMHTVRRIFAGWNCPTAIKLPDSRSSHRDFYRYGLVKRVLLDVRYREISRAFKHPT